jgi:hypothetical protein
MPKMNDVSVVDRYILHTGYVGEDGLPERTQCGVDNPTRIYRLSDGTLVEHSGSTFYAQDGNPMGPKEMYNYLKKLAGYTGIRNILNPGKCWKAWVPEWIWFDKKGYDRIGIPELFQNVPSDHKFMGLGYGGLLTCITPAWYKEFEGSHLRYEELSPDDVQPDLSVENALKETMEKIQNIRETIGRKTDDLKEEERILALLKGN